LRSIRMMQRACHVTALVLNHPVGSALSGRYAGVVTFEVSAGKPDMAMELLRTAWRKGLCTGITTLRAGDFELGTVACHCPFHKKPENGLPQ
jgi:hypothetical protein